MCKRLIVDVVVVCFTFKEDSTLKKCKFCDLRRWKPKKSADNRKKPKPYVKMFYFPLTHRLQHIYAPRNIGEHMRWHHNNRCANGFLCNPLDGEEWTNFDYTCSNFAIEARNVRLGLCVDGFSPFS